MQQRFLVIEALAFALLLSHAAGVPISRHLQLVPGHIMQAPHQQGSVAQRMLHAAQGAIDWTAIALLSVKPIHPAVGGEGCNAHHHQHRKLLEPTPALDSSISTAATLATAGAAEEGTAAPTAHDSALVARFMEAGRDSVHSMLAEQFAPPENETHVDSGKNKKGPAARRGRRRSSTTAAPSG